MEIALFQPSVTKNFEVAVTFLENFFIPFYTFCRRFVTYIQNVPVWNMSFDNILYYAMTAPFCIFLLVAILCYTVWAAAGVI